MVGCFLEKHGCRTYFVGLFCRVFLRVKWEEGYGEVLAVRKPLRI